MQSNLSLTAIDEISSRIGKDKVFTDKATRLCHRFTHGPEAILHSDLNDFLPDAVVRPTCTEEVQEIVRVADKYEVPLVPQGGLTGSYGAEGMRGTIAVDMTCMDKIIEFDERNHWITAEAGVRIQQIVDFLDEKGYLYYDNPTLAAISTLGSRVAINGYTVYENRWGSSQHVILGIEAVLPNGDVVQLGRGSSKPVKSALGYNLLDLFIGSKGTLGIITKVTEKFGEKFGKEIYGVKPFKSTREGLEAFIDLKKPLNSSFLWRTRGAPPKYLSRTVPALLGVKWPQEIKMLTDYHLVGEQYIVERMEEHVAEIMKRHNMLEEIEVPSIGFLGRMQGRVNEYMSISSVGSERIKSGGMGYRMITLDPNIPDGSLVKFHGSLEEILEEIEDGDHYPALAETMNVTCDGAVLPVSGGSTKVWVVVNVNWKKFDEGCRSEFKDWFRKYARLILLHGGSITATHGFIPRELEAELVKRELGEKEYELMKIVKRAIDPKNIMNPKVRF